MNRLHFFRKSISELKLLTIRMSSSRMRRKSRFSLLLILILIGSIGIGVIYCWSQLIDDMISSLEDENMNKRAMYWVDILRKNKTTMVRFSCVSVFIDFMEMPLYSGVKGKIENMILSRRRNRNSVLP